MILSDALPYILKEEGGYVNDKDDPGGATNKGITQAVFDRYLTKRGLPLRSVRYIDSVELEEIYHQNYWIDGKCDFLPAGVNLVHFDFCVNAGVTQAAKTLQGVVGVKRDGKIGPQTLAAVDAYEPKKLVADYSQARREFYTKLAKNRPVLAKFLKGWLNRTNRIEQRATSSIV